MKNVQNKGLAIVGEPTVIESQAGEFRFRLEKSETEYVLPLIQDLPIKQVRALSHTDEAGGIDAIFDLFDALTPGLTDEATQRDITLIIEAWTDASNVTLGE